MDWDHLENRRVGEGGEKEEFKEVELLSASELPDADCSLFLLLPLLLSLAATPGTPSHTIAKMREKSAGHAGPLKSESSIRRAQKEGSASFFATLR